VNSDADNYHPSVGKELQAVSWNQTMSGWAVHAASSREPIRNSIVAVTKPNGEHLGCPVPPRLELCCPVLPRPGTGKREAGQKAGSGEAGQVRAGKRSGEAGQERGSGRAGKRDGSAIGNMGWQGTHLT